MGQSPPGETVLDWDGDVGNDTGLPFIQATLSSQTNTHSFEWCAQPLKVADPTICWISVRAPVGQPNRADRPLCIGRAWLQFDSPNPAGLSAGTLLITLRARSSELLRGAPFRQLAVKNYAPSLSSLPPLPEQRAIAAVLGTIDNAIERTEAVIAATERLRDALLHDLLTRGVPAGIASGRKWPGLGDVPASWEVVRLGDVAEVERGKFAHRPRNEPRFYGGTIPFIQTGDVVRAHGRIRQHTQTLNDLGLSISRLFPAGTIIVTIAANIGETAIADYPVAFPDSLVGVTPTNIETTFLEYFLRTQKERLNQLRPLAHKRTSIWRTCVR